MRKTVLLILISILLLLLVGRFGAWHPVTPLHVAAQWKEVSFTRIKPAARQAGQKEDANVATIKVLKPEHPDSAGQSSDASQP